MCYRYKHLIIQGVENAGGVLGFQAAVLHLLERLPGTIQQDGIHPTGKGSEIIADTLLPALKPLLSRGK